MELIFDSVKSVEDTMITSMCTSGTSPNLMRIREAFKCIFEGFSKTKYFDIFYYEESSSNNKTPPRHKETRE